MSADRPDGEVARRTPAPQSVLRVVRIIEALCARPGAMTLADLARALATPKSSLAALLRGLAEADFVTLADGAYRLGPGAFGMGSALVEARRHVHSSDLVRAGMRRLAERSGETVLFAVRDGDTMTYVDVVESRNSVRFAVAIGDRRPLYCTAGGRALLAAGSDADVRAVLDRIVPEPRTHRTETDRIALVALMAAARASGIAQTVDQAADGVTGTACAIRDASGGAIGALIVAAPSARLHDRHADLARLVREEGAAIARSLGYRPPPEL